MSSTSSTRARSAVHRIEGWDLPRLVSHTLVVPSRILAALTAIGLAPDALRTLGRGEWVQLSPTIINRLVEEVADDDDLVADYV